MASAPDTARHRLVRIAIGVALAVTLLGAILLLPILPDLMFMRQHRRMEDLLDSLAERRPAGVSDRVWGAAVGWMRTACFNICFSTDEVSLPEMKRFVQSLEERLSEPVDLNTVEWIWDRLEKTGPHGRRYVEDYRPEYRREVEFWEKKDGAASRIPERAPAN